MAALRRHWRQPLGRGAYLAHQQAPLLVAIGLAALFQLQPLERQRHDLRDQRRPALLAAGVPGLVIRGPRSADPELALSNLILALAVVAVENAFDKRSCVTSQFQYALSSKLHSQPAAVRAMSVEMS